VVDQAKGLLEFNSLHMLVHLKPTVVKLQSRVFLRALRRSEALRKCVIS
jgi:hypothetical protein